MDVKYRNFVVNSIQYLINYMILTKTVAVFAEFN